MVIWTRENLENTQICFLTRSLLSTMQSQLDKNLLGLILVKTFDWRHTTVRLVEKIVNWVWKKYDGNGWDISFVIEKWQTWCSGISLMFIIKQQFIKSYWLLHIFLLAKMPVRFAVVFPHYDVIENRQFYYLDQSNNFLDIHSESEGFLTLAAKVKFWKTINKKMGSHYKSCHLPYFPKYVADFGF